LISSDAKLTPAVGARPATGGFAGNNYTAQSTWTPPQSISANSTGDAVNNRMGQAYMMADPRVALKAMARNGVSNTGRGNRYFAAIQQQQAMGQGRADSAQIAMQDQATNQKMRTEYQTGRELEAQSLAMSQHQASQADWSNAQAQAQKLARIQAAQQSANVQIANAWA
jgi:hypothetical protein